MLLQVGCSVVVFEYARSSRSDSRKEEARRKELEVMLQGQKRNHLNCACHVVSVKQGLSWDWTLKVMFCTVIYGVFLCDIF